jgi:uncharacterized membrane protein
MRARSSGRVEIFHNNLPMSFPTDAQRASMNTNPPQPSVESAVLAASNASNASAASGTSASPNSEGDQINQNLEAILAFYAREEQKIGGTQRMVEYISDFIGQPAFLGVIVLFVSAWIIGNALMEHFGSGEFDPPPYIWLQGILGLGALLTANIVLSKQNRLAEFEERRAHLDLKVTLLTEQKAAKLIDLIEELRRDLPNVIHRKDPEAAALQQSMNPARVLAALDEGSPEEKAERVQKAAATTRERAP